MGTPGILSGFQFDLLLLFSQPSSKLSKIIAIQLNNKVLKIVENWVLEPGKLVHNSPNVGISIFEFNSFINTILTAKPTRFHLV